MAGVESWDIRARLLLLCAILIAPLMFVLVLYGQKVGKDFDFNARELQGVAELRASWPGVIAGGSSAERRFLQAAGGPLILDDHPDTYRLARALTVTLVGLVRQPVADPATTAIISERASAAASDLSEAAALGRGHLRDRLQQRAAELRRIAAAPLTCNPALVDRLWRTTLDDLQALLEARRAEMWRLLAIQLALIVAFVGGGCVFAAMLVRSFGVRIGRLVAQIDRLINHDTSGQTPFLADRHDLGKLAKGVEALRLALLETQEAWSEVLVNETRYSFITENMHEIVLLAAFDGAIEFASPSAGDIDEGATVWSLMAPADAKAMKAQVALMREGEEFHRPGCRVIGRGRCDVTMRRIGDETEGLVLILAPRTQAETSAMA